MLDAALDAFANGLPGIGQRFGSGQEHHRQSMRQMAGQLDSRRTLDLLEREVEQEQIEALTVNLSRSLGQILLPHHIERAACTASENAANRLGEVGAILDEEQSQDNPRVVNLTNSSGRFDLSYVAPKDEPLFLCAMAFPKGQKPNKVKGVVGQGCTQLEIPLSAPDGVMKLIEASVKVNPEEMPLAPHELDHLSLVSRCYEGR